MAHSTRDGRSVSWWQTLPGVLTALAAVITAMTGMIVALRPSTPPVRNEAAIVEPARSARGIDQPARSGRGMDQSARSGRGVAQPGRSARGGEQSTAEAASLQAARALPLPNPSEVRLAQGTMNVRILSARIEAYNAEKESLVVGLRYVNNGRYPANFWGAKFRLIVEGIPRAPTNSLNEVVDGQSAKEGEVVFEVPTGTLSAALRIMSGDEHTDVPLQLAGGR
jgi:hypothetical protein